MDMMTKFVKDDVAKCQIPGEWDPQCTFGHWSNNVVDKKFYPGRLSTKSAMVQSQGRWNRNFLPSALGRFVPAMVIERAAISQDNGMQAEQVLVRNHVYQFADHPGGIKRWLPVAVVFADSDPFFSCISHKEWRLPNEP